MMKTNTHISTSNLQTSLVRNIVHSILEGTLSYGEHLREVELSKMFAVSRTPIRAALNYLCDAGIIEKRANRGFFVVSEKTDCETLLENLPKSDDEQIKETIARDWFEGKISKEVSEGEVRKRYELGRITTHRILNSLAEDGVIVRMPGYGWQFEPTLNSLKAHDESYDFRIIIETAAITHPSFIYDEINGNIIRDRHLKILDSKETEWRAAELFRLDADFHIFIGQCSNNRFLVQAISQQNSQRRLLEYNSLLHTGRLKASCMEHLKILDCIEKHDFTSAAEAMKLHLLAAKAAGPDF